MVLFSVLTLLDATHAPEHTSQACSNESDIAVFGRSLLQKSPGSLLQKSPWEQQHLSKLSKLLAVSKLKPGLKMVRARDLLPLHLMELGSLTFGSEESLNEVVSASNEIHIQYAGVPISLRIMAGDNAAERFGADGEDGHDYGLETLWELANRSPNQEKITMIDMGANYGVVPIAVYKKFPGLLRAVVTEPMPSTYFFLRWNLWLNGIPDLSDNLFMDASKRAGVLALHRGVTSDVGEKLQMCSSPGWSMNARAVEPTDTIPCDCSVMDCTIVHGVTTDSLFNKFFPQEEITLLKMDCEGCEMHSMRAIAKYPLRVRRLVGELHVPDEDVIDIACLYDSGQYMTKVCKIAEDEWSCCLPLDCVPGRRICKW